ncbi:MAG: epoxide hydrolase N-terminal domain-containing protein, partial [Pseudomonadales bacterium]
MSPRPFTIQTSDEALADLRQRLERTRWPDAETPDDWSQGVPLTYMKQVHQYWLHQYDFRAREALLNQWPAFITEIEGLDIHFLHIRSPREDARPLLMTHGWPGSIVEFQKVIGPLTDPGAHGAADAEAFHLVCRSL